MRWVKALLVAVLASAIAAVAKPAPRTHPRPTRLADTGLYSDFASRTVDSQNLPYSPQYPLWSDGARKRRWIHLPPGSTIDARNAEAWVFPVGTKFWKEFAWSRRVETRFLERTSDGWVYAAYVWADDESDAVLAPEAGILSGQEVAPDKRHFIPSVKDCESCHRAGRSEILGFGALQLSSDRDPLAPHAEPVADDFLSLAKLARRGLVRGLPPDILSSPPRIAASSPRGRATLGYLHANCGGCHDSIGSLASLGLTLRYPLSARDALSVPALAAIGRASRIQLPGAKGTSVWLSPGDPSSSAILARMASRNPVYQMPPLGSKVVDEEAVELISRWIGEDLKGSSP